ncbi:MAG TPA: NAD(P)H-dependent oxidoreductase [Pseudonocardiaceae bacterium]|nr:NAD(P)H-dependent oxidoreductase [Pseudonocardiaceae bacterium]
MSLFRLDTSIRGAASRTSALADLVEAQWRAESVDDSVVRRHIGETPLPATAWSAAVGAHWSPEDQWTPEQREAAALAASLVDELVAADVLIIAAPLYNYGVSQHLKTWVDLVTTDPRMRAGVLAGKPAVLLTARGGVYGPGMPREGWDHATGWMRHIFADTWQLDLTVVEEEMVYVGINPAFDKYKDDAELERAEAVARAEAAGRALASLTIVA